MEYSNNKGSNLDTNIVTTNLLWVKVAQSCLTFCDTMDNIVYGILQAKLLEWVVVPFSRASSHPRNWTAVSCTSGRFLTNWTIRERSQFSSVSQSCLTLCDPMNHSTPGLPVHHKLPELTQTHAHRVGDAIQPSHPLSSPSPPTPYPS